MADDPRGTSVASISAEADSSVNDVVTPLHGLLPAGSAVALAWDDALLGSGCRTSPGSDVRLREVAQALLADDKAPTGLQQPLWERWTHAESGARIVVLADVVTAFSEV